MSAKLKGEMIFVFVNVSDSNENGHRELVENRDSADLILL